MNKIWVVGMGPGSYEEMTVRAVRVLEACETIVGYTVYVDLLKAHFPGKKYVTTPMRQEEARCRIAFEEAGRGRRTAIVCSGDAGIYGMAGLMYEVGGEFPEIEIEVVPGVTAAISGGAVLGAPLGHDCCLISLSDLLTPWETIERRLRAAAEGDFAVSLYNPSSKKRGTYLRRACEVLLEYKPADTVCGIVRNIAREGETFELLTLESLKSAETDMFTTVFVGNRETRQMEKKMVTPRGYHYGEK